MVVLSPSSSLHFQLRPACGLHQYTSQAALEHTQATTTHNYALQELHNVLHAALSSSAQTCSAQLQVEVEVQKDFKPAPTEPNPGVKALLHQLQNLNTSVPRTLSSVLDAANRVLEERAQGSAPPALYAPHINVLDEELGGGPGLAERLWGKDRAVGLVAPVVGAVLPPTKKAGAILLWDLDAPYRSPWMQLSPRALHVLALADYSQAGVHDSITSLSGIVSEDRTCTALHVEQALLGSINLLTAGHPKASDQNECCVVVFKARCKNTIIE